MMNLRTIFLVCWGCCMLLSCSPNTTSSNNSESPEKQIVSSPSGQLKVEFFLTGKNQPAYRLLYQDEPILDISKMSFDFEEQASLDDDLEIVEAKKREFSETWEMPWGEQKEVLNKYNELKIKLKENNELGRLWHIVFRVYDDGIGFRYEFPEQKGWEKAVILDENTQFNLTNDYTCWWIAGDWDTYEHLYSTSKLSQLDALSKRGITHGAQSTIPENAVNTPFTLKSEKGNLYLSFHEANLTDYAGMTLKIDPKNLDLQSELVGNRLNKTKVTRNLPFETPWRTVQVSETAGGLIESNLIVNLNEPNKLGDVSWVKPMKYMGIWWEMHLGKSSWDKASGKHGATTENTKKFIDFASKNNITGLLVEGWNTGWEEWLDSAKRETAFDFVTPYADYDLEAVARYGKEKGVEIIMHHETSGAYKNYENQLDTAYKLMQKLDLHAIKSGYVGTILPYGAYHHGQEMVQHYRKNLETAARYKVAVNAHEPIKPTGLRRTFPNAISREGVRGQEFNAWSGEGGNPPEHISIVAFTRMLAGPIDYTPGIFNIRMTPYKKAGDVNQGTSTLAQQLALYVVIYSPIQMAADLIEHYEGHPAFQFIREVAVDWHETKVLNGEIGDYVTIVRRARDSENWFLGSVTDENPRDLTVKTDFLPEGKKYIATFYADGKDAHWKNNPTDYQINKYVVDKNTTITLQLKAGGGSAISFLPATKEDLVKIESYTQK